jgi:hypothetical protein
MCAILEGISIMHTHMHAGNLALMYRLKRECVCACICFKVRVHVSFEGCVYVSVCMHTLI